MFSNISLFEILDETDINQFAIIGESCKIAASEDRNIPFLAHSCTSTEVTFFFFLACC